MIWNNLKSYHHSFPFFPHRQREELLGGLVRATCLVASANTHPQKAAFHSRMRQGLPRLDTQKWLSQVQYEHIKHIYWVFLWWGPLSREFRAYQFSRSSTRPMHFPSWLRISAADKGEGTKIVVVSEQVHCFCMLELAGNAWHFFSLNRHICCRSDMGTCKWNSQLHSLAAVYRCTGRN